MWFIIVFIEVERGYKFGRLIRVFINTEKRLRGGYTGYKGVY